MPRTPATKRPSKRETASSGAPAGRALRAADRRQAIIEAAFDTFIEKGFAASRLCDGARRAGVAKGTISLNFKDKEALFEELVRSAIVPLASSLMAPPPATGSIRA